MLLNMMKDQNIVCPSCHEVAWERVFSYLMFRDTKTCKDFISVCSCGHNEWLTWYSDNSPEYIQDTYEEIRGYR